MPFRVCDAFAMPLRVASSQLLFDSDRISMTFSTDIVEVFDEKKEFSHEAKCGPMARR
jgi:hypothetical protein